MKEPRAFSRFIGAPVCYHKWRTTTMRAGRCLQFVFAFFLLGVETRGADASYYAIIKSQQYLQTSSAGATLKGAGAWVFDSLVVANRSNAVASATVEAPYGAALQTLLLQPDKMDLLFEQKFDDEATFDALYPAGGFFPPTYSVTMTGNDDGVQIGTVSFESATYPNLPTLGNYDAAQSIDSTTAFALTWNLYGGQTSDVVQVTIVGPATNLVFSSPAPFSSNALNGFSTSCMVPAGTLPSGSTLQAHLSVGRPVGVNTSSYPGATGIAVLGIDIQFPMVTRPAPAPPRITRLSVQPAPIQIQFAGETNRTYHIQYTSNLVSWTDLVVTNSPIGSGVVVDTASPRLGMRFYRIQVGP